MEQRALVGEGLPRLSGRQTWIASSVLIRLSGGVLHEPTIIRRVSRVDFPWVVMGNSTRARVKARDGRRRWHRRASLTEAGETCRSSVLPMSDADDSDPALYVQPTHRRGKPVDRSRRVPRLRRDRHRLSAHCGEPSIPRPKRNKYAPSLLRHWRTNWPDDHRPASSSRRGAPSSDRLSHVDVLGLQLDEPR